MVKLKVFDLGGMGLKVRVQRYPENLTLSPLLLEREVALQAGRINPFLIKAIQEDEQSPGPVQYMSPMKTDNL